MYNKNRIIEGGVSLQIIMNSTEVRKNWSEVIDTVVRRNSIFVKRNRDMVTVLSMEQMDLLLDSFRIKLQVIIEKDGSFTGIVEQLDLLGNAESEQSLIEELTTDLIEYSEEYMNNFNMYYNSPNRRNHFPYIYKVVTYGYDFEKVIGLFEIKAKEYDNA